MQEMDFCDLRCQYAEFPKTDAIDGSGSCRTFVGLYCTLKKTLVMKNKICDLKVFRKENFQKAQGPT
jgi:hypothetical protein